MNSKIMKIKKFNIITFINQKTRGDVLTNMVYGLFDYNKLMDQPNKGDIFETISIWLIIFKCMIGVEYTSIKTGKYPYHKDLFDVNQIFKQSIHTSNDGVSDITVKNGDIYIPFSIKYYNNGISQKDTDICDIDKTFENEICNVGLIVKDKNEISDAKYNHIHKQALTKIKKNNLLFDETDIKHGLSVMRSRKYMSTYKTIDDLLEMVNAEYLFSPRKMLHKYLHQQMVFEKFTKNLESGSYVHLLDLVQRSGKSIVILMIVDYLLRKMGYNKILIMTSVVSTIKGFINSLNTFIEFKDIKYVEQNDFGNIDMNFKGIVFCSVQFLKIDSDSKKTQLKNIGFEAIFIDECHLGSSTIKTKMCVFNNDNDNEINSDVDELRRNIKLCVFASGTSDRTKLFYNIPNNCVYEWTYFDINCMQNINHDEKSLKCLKKRHKSQLINCLNNETLNKDYSKCPKSILLKQNIPFIVKEINEYNTKHGTNMGYSTSSLFALTQNKHLKGKSYENSFELCGKGGGVELLVGFCKSIIDDDERNNLYKDKIAINRALLCQHQYKSRTTNIENPLLFLMFLPTHTGNNTIQILQETLVTFLYNHHLWNNYFVVYTNACSSGYITNDGDLFKYADVSDYNVLLETIMIDTKKHKKKGCILLLGSKGGVGITYEYADVAFHFDDGMNLDQYSQRTARTLTDAKGKTIGINIDLNIQRTFIYQLNVLNKYRKASGSTDTNGKLLKYLYEQNIFIFNPDDKKLNFGNTKETNINEFFETEASSLLINIDDKDLLNEISCDTDQLKNILTTWTKSFIITKNKIKELEGHHTDLSSGQKIQIEINDESDESDEADESVNVIEEVVDISEIINMTLELCKCIVPLLALISRISKITDFKEILIHPDYKGIIQQLIIEKNILKNKIELDPIEYDNIVMVMNFIIDNNAQIINDIREIYFQTPSYKLKEVIAKHFIPSTDEKKKNAEVSTPPNLCSEMISKIPSEFWNTPQKVFEPCCGKGNFVLEIFDKFNTGLTIAIPDNKERCRVIIEECIYFADLTTLNVFITTELLRCEAQSVFYTEGDEEINYKFNSNTCDSLQLNIDDKWGLKGFDAVIGNPPYNSSGDTATGNTIWQDFTKKSLNEWLLPNSYLLFVHPPGWRKPNTERGKFTKMFDLMTKENQMIYLEMHGIKDGQKVFNCGTRYDWYLLENKFQYKNTIIVDEDGKKQEINLSELCWLPNSNILEINKILSNNGSEKCEIIYSPSAYEHRKKWMSHTKTEEFKYTCVHSTPKSGIRYMYSNVNNKGHFNIPKVIIGEAGINDVLIDINGEYGLTNGAIGIKINNFEQGKCIEKALKSDKFNTILKSCSFSSFRVDWNLFKEFKKDFWKEFI